MHIASWTTEYTKASIRTFLPFNAAIRNGVREPCFVEQYFSSQVKTLTQDWPLERGYLSEYVRTDGRSKCAKFYAAMDMFGSTGWEFCMYGLSKEELAMHRNKFKQSNLTAVGA
jgi:hypothetical protein